MSFKPQVQAGRDPEFCGNALAFATHEEARLYAVDLMGRWTSVVGIRVVESAEPVTYAWVGGKLVLLGIAA